MGSYEVNVEAEATPLVRVLASTLRLALQRAETQKILAGLEGQFTIKDLNSPKAATFIFEGEDISIRAGTSRQAKVTIEADLDKGKAKPKVHGLYRHPLSAKRFGQLLDLPLPNWADSAKRFWAATHDLPNMPEKLIITNKEEDRGLSFGEGTEIVEIIGKTRDLENLLAGHGILVDEVMKGRLQIRSSLQHMTGISNACQKLLMGELDG